MADDSTRRITYDGPRKTIADLIQHLQTLPADFVWTGSEIELDYVSVDDTPINARDPRRLGSMKPTKFSIFLERRPQG